MDTSILEDLGLTRAEIKVYVALLETGASSAGQILERSRLHNSVVHRALNSLIEKGLISFILEGKKKVYRDVDPKISMISSRPRKKGSRNSFLS